MHMCVAVGSLVEHALRVGPGTQQRLGASTVVCRSSVGYEQ